MSGLDEGTYTLRTFQAFNMQQEKIALKTAAKIANVNGPLHKHRVKIQNLCNQHDSQTYFYPDSNYIPTK